MTSRCDECGEKVAHGHRFDCSLRMTDKPTNVTEGVVEKASAIARSLYFACSHDDGDGPCGDCLTCEAASKFEALESRLRMAVEAGISALDLLDELYRKYGLELDPADGAKAQSCRDKIETIKGTTR